MKNKLYKLASEEAAKLDISPEDLLELAEEGCKILYQDDLNKRITLLGGLDNAPDEIKEFLLICAKAAALYRASSKNKN